MARPVPPINARKVEAVLDSLRREINRGREQLTRDPRGTVEGAVQQLLSLARPKAPDRPDRRDPDRRTYRIDDLAQISGVTVRNIRAYQERGLLPPPERRGRVALFDDAHVSRLKIISSMLERGYATAHISEMLAAWEGGKDIADVLGLEGVLVAAHVGDDPVTVSKDEARELSGGEVEFAVFVDAGLITLNGDSARLVRPDLLRAFAEMKEYGIGAKDLVKLHRDVSVSVDTITRRLVDEAVNQIGHRFLGEEQPTSAELAELVAMLARFRELALGTVTSTLATSLEQTVEDLLATYLADVLAKPSATDAS